MNGSAPAMVAACRMPFFGEGVVSHGEVVVDGAVEAGDALRHEAEGGAALGVGECARVTSEIIAQARPPGKQRNPQRAVWGPSGLRASVVLWCQPSRAH